MEKAVKRPNGKWQIRIFSKLEKSKKLFSKAWSTDAAELPDYRKI